MVVGPHQLQPVTGPRRARAHRAQGQRKAWEPRLGLMALVSEGLGLALCAASGRDPRVLLAFPTGDWWSSPAEHDTAVSGPDRGQCNHQVRAEQRQGLEFHLVKKKCGLSREQWPHL